MWLQFGQQLLSTPFPQQVLCVLKQKKGNRKHSVSGKFIQYCWSLVRSMLVQA